MKFFGRRQKNNPGKGRNSGRGGGRRAVGRGQGRGRMGGKAAGPGGVCVCTNPDCDYQVQHKRGVPCYKRKCPKCGSPLTRK